MKTLNFQMFKLVHLGNFFIGKMNPMQKNCFLIIHFFDTSQLSCNQIACQDGLEIKD